MKPTRLCIYILALIVGSSSHQSAFAANNCIQLLRGVQNQVHQEILNCESQTGQTYSECKKVDYIVQDLQDGVGDYVNCMNWAPSEGYTLQIGGGVTATCNYEYTDSQSGSQVFHCDIARSTIPKSFDRNAPDKLTHSKVGPIEECANHDVFSEHERSTLS